MKLGGAAALLGLLAWAAFFAEYGDWFLIPACVFLGIFILWFIAYVAIVDGSERDVHHVLEASHRGYGKKFHVPYTPEPYNAQKFVHSPHRPGWFKRFWSALWKWEWPRKAHR